MALVETDVQVVAVACSFQVRLRGHRGPKPHPVGHAPDRLQYHNALVRRSQRFVLPHGELEVSLPDLGVALLRPDTHLLQRLCQLRDEVRRRGQRVAPCVWRPVQWTLGIPDVELDLVRGERPVASI
jgi:hypothetical protein